MICLTLIPSIETTSFVETTKSSSTITNTKIEDTTSSYEQLRASTNVITEENSEELTTTITEENELSTKGLSSGTIVLIHHWYFIELFYFSLVVANFHQ